MCTSELWVNLNYGCDLCVNLNYGPLNYGTLPGLGAGRNENPAYGQHWALLYVCHSGVPTLYHHSKSIPLVLSVTLVHVYTMSPCLYQRLCIYHESMYIPLVHVYTIRSCLYYESMSIP